MSAVHPDLIRLRQLAGMTPHASLPPATPPMEPTVTGLQNLGNTCFFNSVIQVLTQTATIANYMREGSANQRIQGNLSTALCVLIRMMEKKKGNIVSPDVLWKLLCQRHTAFAGYGQQDAQELLRLLLDSLEEEYAGKLRTQAEKEEVKPESSAESPIASEASKELPVEKEADNANDEQADVKAEGGPAAKAKRTKKKSRSKANNIIAKSFRGTFESTVRCNTCGSRRSTQEKFHDVSVELPSAYSYEREEFALHRKRLLVMLEERERAYLEQQKSEKREEPKAAEEPPPAKKEKKKKKRKKAGGKEEGGEVVDEGPKAENGEDAGVPEEGEVEGAAKGKEVEEKVGGAEVANGTKAEVDETEEEEEEGVVAVSVRAIERFTEPYTATSVMHCLRSFCGIEVLDRDNMVACSKCGEAMGGKGEKVLSPSAKQLCVGTVPTVLTVHLKRFVHTMYGMMKNDEYVSFPTEMAIDPFVLKDSSAWSKVSDLSSIQDDYPHLREVFKDTDYDVARKALLDLRADQRCIGKIRYRLFGVVVHSGHMHSGHYFTFIRPFERGARSDDWYLISDTYSKKVSIFEVLRSHAYLLMYERLGKGG